MLGPLPATATGARWELDPVPVRKWGLGLQGVADRTSANFNGFQLAGLTSISMYKLVSQLINGD